ncbi:MAG: nucleotidyl transferase AbiEii/AbiGii toxin family protein [Nocardioidaceae bacterium]
MTERHPTRRTTAGRAYLDLQNKARRERRPTDELDQLYALEGFLARLAASSYADRFVVKGGVLLSAYDARRPTRDIDMQGQRISSQVDNILRIVRHIAAIDLDDGLAFDTGAATAGAIRDVEEYGGARVSLSAALSTARLSLHIDVNVGDPIWPAPQPVAVPRLLGGTLELTGYPLHMVLAEKIVTAVQRGTANTRWRDFADIYALTNHNPVPGNNLQPAMNAVADYRQVELAPLAQVLHGFDEIGQPHWITWRRRLQLEDDLPEQFSEVLAAVETFTDPALSATVSELTWQPTTQTWTH